MSDLSSTETVSLELPTMLMSEIVFALRHSGRHHLAELVKAKTGVDAPGPVR